MKSLVCKRCSNLQSGEGATEDLDVTGAKIKVTCTHCQNFRTFALKTYNSYTIEAMTMSEMDI